MQMIPIFSPSNFTGIGQARSVPIFRRENTFHYIDNVTWTHGQHTIKFGGDIRRRQLTEWQTNRGNGRFNFSPGFTAVPGVSGSGNSMASFELGYATLIEMDYSLAWVGMRALEAGLYVADDWRISKRLTLNVGLRWDYYSPFSEVCNRWADFDFPTATIMIAGYRGVGKTAGVQNYFRDYAPRLGFAYQLASRTVIRGGYGLFYNPNGNGGVMGRGARMQPFGPVLSVSPGDQVVATRVSDGFPLLPTIDYSLADNPTGSFLATAENFRSSVAQQFNLTVEHEISAAQLLLKAAFVGNLGRHLYMAYDHNQPIPGPGATGPRRPLWGIRPAVTSVSIATADGDGNYHAFQATAEKRFSHGLSMLLGYTWSHSIDDVGTDFGGGYGPPQDPRCLSCDRGNSAFDIRHRFTAGYAYLLPWGKGRPFLNRGGVTNFVLGGWQTNGSITMQTGLPFTPTLQTTTVNTGTGSRPDRIADGTLPSGQRSIGRWFNTSAFVSPALYTYGNAAVNCLYGPGRVNFDVSLFKEFPIKEEFKAQFRAEAFNVFNTPQFGLPNASIGSPTAGVISSVVGNPRQLQVALRLQF